MILQDFRHAVRSLLGRSGTSAAIVLVLAVGMGLPTVIFALADPYVLRPLPFTQPHELALIQVSSKGVRPGEPVPTFQEWQTKYDLFLGLAAFRSGPTLQLDTQEGRVRFATTEVSANFLRVLGGGFERYGDRLVLSSDGANTILVTQTGLDVLPSDLRKHGSLIHGGAGGSVIVSGVLPPSFIFPEALHALVPFRPGPIITVTGSSDGQSWTSTGMLSFVARLKRGVSTDLVQRALSSPLQSGGRLGVRVESLPVRMTEKVRPIAVGALCAGLLIWVVCIGNGANMFLARSTYRAPEIATRRALGASRLDILRFLSVELLVIVSAALAVALTMAWVALKICSVVVPAEYISLGAPSVTGRVVVFCVLAGTLAVVLGLAPASLVHPTGTRSLGLRQFTASRRASRLRFSFAVLQTTLAIVLAVGAALLVQSRLNLTSQEKGYDESALYVGAQYPRDRSEGLLERDVVETLARLKSVPGIAAVAATTGSIVGDVESKGTVGIGGKKEFVDFNEVTPGFFEATGMRVVMGRPIGPEDAFQRGVVVNEAFARAFGDKQLLLGEVLSLGTAQSTIVGVVGDALAQGLAAPPVPAVYSSWQPGRGRAVRYVFRMEKGVPPDSDRVRRAIAGVNPDVIVTKMNTIGDRLADSVKAQAFATLVLVLFCGSAAIISIAGLVGIVTFTTARRTREIAIRVALGAEPFHVRRLVAGEALAAAGAGSSLGLLIGHWLSRWLESFVFGVSIDNWFTAFGAVGLTLFIMACASLLSAEQAVRLQPVEAMRAD